MTATVPMTAACLSQTSHRDRKIILPTCKPALSVNRAQVANLNEENERLKAFMEELSISQRDLYLKNQELTEENKQLTDLLSQMDKRCSSQADNYEAIISSLKSAYGQIIVGDKNLENRMCLMKEDIAKIKQNSANLEGQFYQTTQDFTISLIVKHSS